jgi:hypothetical protein
VGSVTTRGLTLNEGERNMSSKKKETNTNNLQEGDHNSTRRAFLRNGLLVTGSIGFGIRKVLAEAQQTGKPAFTAATVNKLSANSSEAKYREMFLVEAQQDLKAFVRKTFYLTSSQDQVLDDLTPDQVAQIQNFLKQTGEKKKRVKIAVTYGPPPRDRQRADVFVSLPAVRSSAGKKDERGNKAMIFKDIFAGTTVGGKMTQ